MKTTTADTAPRHENRLARETSPYLLQHAHNPVDWFPWGEEAFAEARRRNVPIFLSIGYSTCYWCHVMERESFEDEATAALLNERMVAIKVDREERPDVDEIYMTACQVFTQLTEGRASGGWPLSVVLEPATLRPFFVGTYFPPREMYGRTSFAQVVTALSDAWMNRRDDVLTQADRLATLVRDQLAQAPPRRAVGDATVKEAVGTLMRVHDREHGGFGGAPKFPQVPYLNLLAQVAWDNATVREALRRTADEMAIGGLFDQVGGGFHRYCVDATWTVPHFEKMLYDNGQLASFYATLVERTGDPYHAETLRRTLDYVLREMTSQEGAFFSAQDAEVDAREGASYVWTPDELKAALGAETEAGAGTGAAPGPAVDPAAERWRLARSLYGIDAAAEPNFRDPHHPQAPPAWVLRLPRRPDALAAELGLDATSFAERRAAIDRALKHARDARPQPRLDDKVIASWNGLMIAGMADGGRALREPRYVAAAARAADAVLSTMRTAEGADGAGGRGLLRIRRGNSSRIPAFLEDYALLANGLLALHRADGDARWLREAAALADAAIARFRDPRGGFFDTLDGQGDLFVRTRSLGDGAVPSGNSAMLHVLLELADRTGDARWLDEAAQALAGLGGAIAEHPVGAALAVAAIDRMARTHADRLPRGDDPALAGAGADPAQRGGATIGLSAEPREIDLGAGPRTFEIVLALPDGLHVNAHEPGGADLVGVRVALLDGEGLELEVDYPRGEPLADGRRSSAAAVLVHHGTVRLPATIRVVGEVTGRPSLLVTFQPCTATACLAPMTRAVPITIRR